MHTFDSVHGPGAIRGGKFASVLIVGSLHLGAIYTLLVALDIVSNPVAPPPPQISVRVLDQTKTTPQPPPNVDSGVILVRPTEPNPMPPPLDIQNPPSGPGAITPNTQTSPVTPIAPGSGPTIPVRAVTATHTIPPYPTMAIRFGYEGTVRLRITVDERGTPVSADVTASSGHSDLDEAAVTWVKAHWRYEPALQNGNAMSATTNAVVTFRLNQLH